MAREITTSLKSKLHEQFRVPGNNANPEIEIIVSRARYSVTDTSQFQVDTIREKTGLGDLGVDIKRADETKSPTTIYEVHNDNGTIKTATRDLPAIPKNEWAEGETIASGTLCRLAFNGNWIWNYSKGKYIFKTEGDPFIFYTDSSNNLQVQTWESSTDREQLATTVTVSMDCIRGWRENNTTANDQGMIVAYIKTDGKCYYRQYLYDGSSDYEWKGEQEVTLTGVTDSFTKVVLFRTTDYRLGFCITTSANEVYWKITDRQWAGLALHPETIEAAIEDYAIDLIEITTNEGYETEALEAGLNNFSIESLYALPVEMESAENVNDSGDYGSKIEVTFDADVYNTTGQAPQFTVKDGTPDYFMVLSAALKSGHNDIMVLTVDDFNSATGNLTITYTYDIGGLQGQAGQIMQTNSVTFTPTGLVPPTTPAPTVSTIANIEGSEL